MAVFLVLLLPHFACGSNGQGRGRKVVISAVSATGITQNSATVAWATSIAANSQVEYGTTTAYGSSTTLDTTLVTQHSQSLTGLAAGTLYHYRVHSGTSVSTDFTFTTAQAPVSISAVSAGSITASSATITWTTNVAANSQVEYGTTTAYGSGTALDSTLVTQHSQTLTGLAASTLYHYRVHSGAAVSADATFTTAAAAPTTLTISGVAATSVSSTSELIAWTTNLGATSQVEYGTTTAYGSATTVDSALLTSHSVTLTGLTPGTLYHFRVRSTSADNQTAVSPDSTFTTPATASTGLCQSAPTGKMVAADPTNYQSLLSILAPGDTLSLAPGNYKLLYVSNKNGTATQCITITGPSSGSPAVIQGVNGYNTVEIISSSYVALKNLTIDSLGIDGAFGISANNGVSHHILIEGNTLVGMGASQSTDGISTKVPTWNWVIRRNRIIGAGTGIYLGNSDGSAPFVAGIIEDNLVQNPIGYCMEIKYQTTRPTIAGMPTGPSSTIIRNNTFIKNDQPSPAGDRPNLLVGGFPDSGAGSSDLYEIYGNFLYHNPREALFQGSGRISFHDNVLVDGEYAAAVFVNHDLALKLAYVYNNTIYTRQAGIYFGSSASQGDAVIGNLVFAASPIGGSITNQSGNMTDAFANAGLYVNAPSFTLGSMDFYPRTGQAQGTAFDMSLFTTNADYAVDFNGTSKAGFTFRGAYAGSGTNPGWQLQADIKPVP